MAEPGRKVCLLSRIFVCLCAIYAVKTRPNLPHFLNRLCHGANGVACRWVFLLVFNVLPLSIAQVGVNGVNSVWRAG